jgi:DNA polymerase-3 subunit epsilon
MAKVYNGSLKDGLYHGKGELVDSIAGFTYKGDFKKGLMHGDGTVTWNNGYSYKGWFKDGLYHGKGHIKYSDGSEYIGEFEKGIIEGAGKLTNIDGSVYDGEFINGIKEGNGYQKYADGSEYIGRFKNNRREGKGELNLPNRCSYKGYFANDLLHGKGVWSFPCGGLFECEFNNGLLNGRGNYQDHKGNCLSGRFSQDILWFGQIQLRDAPNRYMTNYGLDPTRIIQDERITELICSLRDSIDKKIAPKLFSLPNKPNYKPQLIHQLITDVLFFNINEKLQDTTSKLKIERVRDILNACDISFPSELINEVQYAVEHDIVSSVNECHYLFFDTETTGLPKNYKASVHDLNNWPRLVQLAFIGYDEKGVELFKGNRIVKPIDYTIPTDAARIHGITTEKALSIGIDPNHVLKEFEELAANAQVLVAHNMDFDDKIVGSELLRCGAKNILAEKKKICTMKSSTDFCKINGPYGYKWPKLSELYQKLFGVDFEEAHNAAADIQATAKCFWTLIELGIIKNESSPHKDITPTRPLAYVSPRDLEMLQAEAEAEGFSFDPSDPYAHMVTPDLYESENVSAWMDSVDFTDNEEYLDDADIKEFDTTIFKLQLVNQFKETSMVFGTNGKPIIESGAPLKKSVTLFRYAIVGANSQQKAIYKKYANQNGHSNYLEINGYPIYITHEFMGNLCEFHCTRLEDDSLIFVWDSREIDALQAMAEKYPHLAVSLGNQIAALMLAGNQLDLGDSE